MNKYQELMNALQEKINIAEHSLKNLSEKHQKTQEAINNKENDANTLDKEINSLEKLENELSNFDMILATFFVFLSVWTCPTVPLTFLAFKNIFIMPILRTCILLGVTWGIEAFCIINTIISYKKRKKFIKTNQAFEDKKHPTSALQNALKKKKSRKKGLTEDITSLKSRLAKLTEIITSDSLKVDTLYQKRNYLEHEFLQAILKATPLNQSIDATIDQEFIDTKMPTQIENIPTERTRKKQ